MARKSSSRKISSKPLSSKASGVLRDGRTSKAAKSLAGSVMAQARAKKK